MLRIDFHVGGQSACFTWEGMRGHTVLRVGDQVFELQAPVTLATLQASTSLTRTWTQQVGPHLLTIVKRRPLLFAGFRANEVTIWLEGEVIAHGKGR